MPDREKTIRELDRIASVLFDSLSLLKEQPEIVRCKDCAYALFKEGAVEHGHIFCTKPFTERWQAVKPDDWYCADGERREWVKPTAQSATDWDGVECE